MTFKNKNISFIRIAFFLVSTSLLAGCVTDSGKNNTVEVAGKFERLALASKEIYKIQKDEKRLFLSSNSGVFSWDTEQQRISDLGLNDKQILGVVNLSDGLLLAGTKASDFSSGDTTLFRFTEGENSWEPYMNNFGGERGIYTYISTGPLQRDGETDSIWLRAGNSVANSDDGGSTWKLVSGEWDNWGGAAVLLYLDPNRDDEIWAGGVNAFSEPYLFKTTNNGESWENLSSGLSENSEAVAYDIITHSKKRQTILVGLGGTVSESNKIKRSNDNGQNWTTVAENVGTYAFTSSAKKSDIVYASGRNPQSRLFFLASGDFGETWQTIEFEGSPGEIYVNDMVSVMEGGKEILYLATNKGLYTYAFDE